MNAALYCRISRAGEHEDSTALQVTNARAECARLGWPVVESYVVEEVESGRLSREGLSRLLAGAKLRPRPFDVVVTRALDRTARDLGLMLDMFQALSDEDVKVYTYQDRRFVPFDSSMDQFMVSAHALPAAQYAESVGKNAYDALREKVKLGHWTGHFEFGFRYERHCSCPGSKCTSKACYTARLINDETAAVVNEIFALADTGHGDLKIAQTLTAKYGDRFGAWSKDRVRGILTNTIYDGRVIWGMTKAKVKKVDGEKVEARVKREQDDWTRGPAPRIVDHDLWERVQAHRRKIAAQYGRTEDGRLLTKPEDRTKKLSTSPALI